MILSRSEPQSQSGSKRPRMSMAEKRAKEKEEKRAMREHMEKEEAEPASQAQEEADFEMAERLQEEDEFDARRQEAEAWERQQAMNPDSNPLLMPRESESADTESSTTDSTQPRLFIPAECLGCRTIFTRDARLIDHLALQEGCMHAMGGNVQAARKLVKKMKDNQRNKESGARNQRYQENSEKEKQARNKRYEGNPSPEKEADKERYRANPEHRKEVRNKRYEDNPSPEKQARNKRYKDNPSPERQAKRERYHSDALGSFVASGRYGPSYPCIVCHELHWQGGTVVVALDDFDDRFVCRDYILRNKSLFFKLDNYHCCKTCKPKVDVGLMPNVAAKNSLECPWDTVPRELLKLSEVILSFRLLSICNPTNVAGRECCFGPKYHLCQHTQHEDSVWYQENHRCPCCDRQRG